MHKKIQTPALFTLLLGVLLFPSCSTMKTGAEHAAVYQSYANSLADIRLELQENNRFDYGMTIYPEPQEPESAVPEHFQFRGRWTTEDGNYILLFRRRNKPNLYALFGQVGDMETNVRVISERRISFPVADAEIVVWGIVCFRERE